MTTDEKRNAQQPPSSETPVVTSSLVGQRLGQYEIREEIGRGGMAMVYKAYQPSLGRYVAIKVLPLYHADAETFNARFIREARAVARLEHPHILPIYDFGREGELSYIVTKYVVGGTLKDQLGQPFDLQCAASITTQVASALDYAHDQGIIHRDVKPSNILLDRGEWALLTDFGLAKMIGGSVHITGSGVGIGTPAYMSPEQGQGLEVDRRSDVYSLGVILYEMLTGRTPYDADSPLTVMVQHITKPLPSPRLVNPDIPIEVERVILKALMKDPVYRYAYAGDLAIALGTAVEKAEETPRVQTSPSAETITEAAAPPPARKRTHEVPPPAKPVKPDNSPPGWKRIPAAVFALVAIMALAATACAVVWTLARSKLAAPTPTFTVAEALTATTQAAGIPATPTPTALVDATATPPAGTAETPSAAIPTTASPTVTITPTVTAPPTATPSLTPAPPAEPAAGTTKVFGDAEMVYVPSGTFTMGSDSGEPDEAPAHTVYLDGFWIDRTEVTNAAFQKCVEAGVCSQPIKSSDSRDSYYSNPAFADYPVIYMNHYDAEGYCRWVGKRLPTEAEWEKAARGTDGRSWPWGDTFDPGKLALGPGDDTAQVGSNPAGASPYGVMDMAGNVLEWVADWYASDYYGQSPERNPRGPATGLDNVLRGGRWWDAEYDLRTTRRWHLGSNTRNPALGFRCASDR
jgi:serine/threonine protein kinase/formylglycine-generating enzyme required for sulfatase activity